MGGAKWKGPILVLSKVMGVLGGENEATNEITVDSHENMSHVQKHNAYFKLACFLHAVVAQFCDMH